VADAQGRGLRVTVPALMDAFAARCFFNRGLLVGVLA
jgi:hypothetical protein